MRKSTVTSTVPAPIKFGALSESTVERIENNDAVHSASSAHFEMQAKLDSLRRQYVEKVAEIQSAYLKAIGGLNGVGVETE